MCSLTDVKFLLVDGIDESMLSLQALLQRDDLEILRVQSGAEALRMLLEHDFALALIAAELRDMNGFALAELMRGTERSSRVPIIFLTEAEHCERRPFRGYEAGAVDFLVKPVDPRILTNKVNVFYELAKQRQELALQRDELRQTAQQLSDALGLLQAHGNNSPLAVVQFDPEFRVTMWSEGAERLFGWSPSETLGKAVSELNWLRAESLEGFKAMANELLDCPRNVRLLRALRRDGSEVECEWYNSALLAPDGKLVSVNAQILDITERRRAEETQQLLIGELNHRVKNMLATVQAIAGQTLKHSKAPSEFARNFSGRIRSLARAHSLLSSATWKGASLFDLVRDQLDTSAVESGRVTADGPDICLAPQIALHLAMILHELGTNAIKHGALSNSQGQINVSWSVDDSSLHLNWTESCCPPPQLSSKRGFGTSLIEQSISADGGEAYAIYNDDGIVWKITVPLAGRMEQGRVQPSPKCMDSRRAPVDATKGRGLYASSLEGRRILVIEDEPLLALELATMLEDAGLVVIGPAGSAEEALQFIETTQVDGALLDGNLKGRPVDNVAAALAEREVPFVFVSGYGRDSLPPTFRDVPLLGKPYNEDQLLHAAARMLSS